MTLKLKICRVTDYQTAAQLLELGVDYLGFHVLDESNEQQEATVVATNSRLRHGGFDGGVLLTRSRDLKWVASVVERGDFRYLQLHRNAELHEVATIATAIEKFGAVLIQVVDPNVRPVEYIDAVLTHAEFVLYDNYVGGTGIQIAGSSLQSLRYERAFIAGGIDAKRAMEVRESYDPYGVDVQSWVELPDLTKDLIRVSQLVAAVGGSRA